MASRRRREVKMIAMMTVAAWLAGAGGVPLSGMDEAQARMIPGEASVAVPGAADDPLTRPIEVERARKWLAPLPPEKIFGTSYLVGFAG